MARTETLECVNREGFDIFARYLALRTLLEFTVVPVLVLSALALEKMAHTDNDQATGNCSVRAQK